MAILQALEVVEAEEVSVQERTGRKSRESMAVTVHEGV
jgi:hypothetical protein